MLTSTCLISEDGPRKKRVARIASRNVGAEVGFFPAARRETSDILGIVLCVNGCDLRGREQKRDVLSPTKQSPTPARHRA